MKSIKVYSAESIAGLSDKIKSNNSVAYTASVEACSKELIEKVLSAVAKDGRSIETLYPVKSLLVSTNWNQNDDVFSPSETWAARHTPINTQTNIDHKHDQIIGHITSVWVIDNNGNLVDDKTKEIPEKFHICDGSVIYRTWQNKELQERIDNLIEQIDAGKMYVSMECLFPDFDYAVISPKDEYYTIARTEDTAFLTKHLRSYGGTGIFQEYKIGRLLKGMVFSGKGFVNSPANPNSIIFEDPSELTEFSFSSAKEANPFDTSVSVVAGLDKPMENNMSNEIFKEQLDKAEASNASLKQENETLKTELSDANVSSLRELIEKLEAENAALASAQEEKEAVIKSGLDTLSELEGKMTELSDAKEKIEEELETAKTEKLIANRVSILVAGGLSKEDASEKVSKFEYLNDKQFEEIAEAILAGVVTDEDADVNADDDSTDKDDTSSAEASDKVLENADVTDESDDMGSVDTNDTGKQDKVRQAMANIFSDETEEETVS